MKKTQLTKQYFSTSLNETISISNCLLLSLPCSSQSFAHYTVPMLLYTKPPRTTNKTNIINVQAHTCEAACRMVQGIQSSVFAKLEEFLNSPLLKKVLSLPSHFHNFSKIHKENSRNVSFVSNHNFAAILPGDSVAGVVVANGILNFLNIYNTLLIVRLVLTWFPNSPPAIVSPLSTLCDPYLNIFRGIIPPLGGTLDLSPILAFLVLNVFTSTASALPAELPPTVKSHNHQISSANLTSSQQKFTRRFFQSKTKSSSDDI